MARLNAICDSDEEFPDVSTLLRRSGTTIQQTPRKGLKKEHGNEVPPEHKNSECTVKAIAVQKDVYPSSRDGTEVSCNEKQSSRQRSLGTAQVNSLLLPITGELLAEANNSESCVGIDNLDGIRKPRSSPRRTARRPLSYRVFVPEGSSASGSEDKSYFDDLSEFIVNDSASESEKVPTRSPGRKIQRTGKMSTPLSRKCNQFIIDDSCSDGGSPPQNSEGGIQKLLRKPKLIMKRPHLPVPVDSSFALISKPEVVDLTSPAKAIPSPTYHNTSPKRQFPSIEPGSPGDSNHGAAPAVLQFFPPRSRSPYKILDGIRPVTPPSSPSRPRLQSPSRRNRIPPSPHRSSIDAFWSQDVINDWNDQYSPKKSPKTSKALKLFSVSEDDEAELSPSESPRKSPTKGPKLNKRAAEQRKAFNEKKHELASSFLKELDETINDGKVAALASSAGGIHIIWSKKLNSTAGRANWKREASRSKNADGTVATTSYRHHASIELAEKVIDDEDRLINVIAHEYCHLANFMISGVKNNPHGKGFKDWARKCTTAFSHRNINVTTKHSYTIIYKYIWACTSCGTEFKRHSKSVDPSRHSCGSCKNKLVQVQPAPRVAKDGRVGGLSEYQEFMKVNFARVRRENEGVSQSEVMKELGKEFREMKAKMGEARSGSAEVAIVEDSEEEDGKRSRGGEGGAMDDVARKLEFLKLG